MVEAETVAGYVEVLNTNINDDDDDDNDDDDDTNIFKAHYVSNHR